MQQTFGHSVRFQLQAEVQEQVERRGQTSNHKEGEASVSSSGICVWLPLPPLPAAHTFPCRISSLLPGEAICALHFTEMTRALGHAAQSRASGRAPWRRQPSPGKQRYQPDIAQALLPDCARTRKAGSGDMGGGRD